MASASCRIRPSTCPNGSRTPAPDGPQFPSSPTESAKPLKRDKRRRFSGQLHDCQSNLAGAPTSGTLAVGQQVVVPTPNGSATYAEPLATGSGTVPVNSCPGGATQGTGVASWPDGTNTVVDYTTSSVGPAVNLQGTVVASVTLPLVSGPVGSPPTHTITTNNATFPVGNGVQGAVAFTTNDAAPCTTAAGLSSVAIEGTIGLGSTG